MVKKNVFFIAVVLLYLWCAIPSNAQDWSWPEKPSNLQVLPKDWSGTRLIPVMRDFVRGLGVRCSHCHKGVEGKPLSTYDFASDENPNKNRAREMFRMLGSINDQLKKIEPSGDKRVNMGCHTCHRGRPRPMTLAEELGEKYRKDGLKPALDLYADLKKKFADRGAYDFGEAALNDLGYEVLGKNDTAGALQIFTLNAELFPKSPKVFGSLGEAYLKAGDSKLSQENYEKVLALDPANKNAKEALAKIQETKVE